MTERQKAAHAVYIAALRRLTPEQRLKQAFEMSARMRRLFEQGLRERFPDMPEEEFRKLLRKRLELCHNRNW
jgi:hypothetical protein